MIRGLGFGDMHRKFDIQSLDHAIRYIEHDEILKNYVAIIELLYKHVIVKRKSIEFLFKEGHRDVLRVISSLTLFSFAIETLLSKNTNKYVKSVEDKLRKLKEGSIDKVIQALGYDRCVLTMGSMYL